MEGKLMGFAVAIALFFLVITVGFALAVVRLFLELLGIVPKLKELE